MSMIKQLLEAEQENDTILLIEMIEQSADHLIEEGKRAGIISSAIKGAKDLIGKNPALAVGAGIMAVNAYSNFKKSQRNTIRLHAKTPYEKKMMTTIVDTLTQKGPFKIKRIKFEHGGKTWELLRKM